jgi:Lhr-like helicase
VVRIIPESDGRLLAIVFTLKTGNSLGLEQSIRFLDEGIRASSEYGIVTMWWAFTLTRHMLDDLWDQSLYKRLPTTPTKDTPWDGLRWLFISKLFKQNRAEVELWPSQVLAATRAIDETDDLVVTLPTSAGKTRIAELCILKALSMGQRVVFVTPLRALSAQTERSLRQTFAPLGFTVSALYGSSGSVGDDTDSLRNREIVISTPEKLDFALRNDPTLLDNVGLIVLDEAHMLGLGEREVRYEVLVQRLLRREDAANRRIVCLSAILPQGEQLEDFVALIRQDQQGHAISENWRPTRQRFGRIFWHGQSARLNFDVEHAEEEDLPYLNSFIGHLLTRYSTHGMFLRCAP